MEKNWIVGIDEVGRGPLAGPVTVCAVAVRARKNFTNQKRVEKLLSGIKNSKKLSAKQRDEWARKFAIYNSKFSIAISSVGNKTIDRLGISKAAKLAVSRCLNKIFRNHKLSTKNYKLVLDGGLFAPPFYLNQKTIIKGDEKLPLIAAASIVAKVTRDKKMIRLDKKYPQYGFAVHKGYGTKIHREAIVKNGFCDIHRRSFCAKFI